VVGPLDYLGPGNVALDQVSGNFYMVQWYDNALHELAAAGTSVLRSADVGTSLWQLVVDRTAARSTSRTVAPTRCGSSTAAA